MVSSICWQPSEDRDLQEFIIAVLGVEVFMIVFFMECKVYDLSTAMFFAFALGCLARGNFNSFYGLFLISCFNRETTILLSTFFAVHYFWKMETLRYVSGLGMQGFAFLGTRAWLMKLYEGNVGQSFYFWPIRVIGGYWSEPIQSLILVGACAVAGYFVARHWKEKPEFLRCALSVLLPLLFILHLMLGIAFEIRVFAEIFPVAWVMAFWTLDKREPRV
jgi:hypothetical protein